MMSRSFRYGVPVASGPSAAGFVIDGGNQTSPVLCVHSCELDLRRFVFRSADITIVWSLMRWRESPVDSSLPLKLNIDNTKKLNRLSPDVELHVPAVDVTTVSERHRCPPGR